MTSVNTPPPRYFVGSHHILYKNKGLSHLDVSEQNLQAILILQVCYTYPMKRIYISDAIHQQLKTEALAEGRTLQWVAESKLTKTGVPQKTTEVETPYMKYGGTSPKADVLDLLKPTGISGAQYDSYEKKSAEATPRVLPMGEAAADREQVCCMNTNRPCKHWVWDTSTGQGYVNSLSGRIREAE